MKNLFIILLCFLSLCLTSCKEEVPTENIENEKVIGQDLFPLQIGNTWVYQLTDLSKEYWTVIGTDAVDENTFYNIEIKNPIKGISRVDNYRIDPETGLLYRGGGIQTNLSFVDGNHEIKGNSGSTYLWINVTTSDEELFGSTESVVTHRMTLQETEKTYSFVKGLGIISKYSGGYLGYGEYNDKLIGAVINNIEYGDTSFVEYDSDIYFYPLATGNKWFYEYNHIQHGDTIRSTRLKREIVGEELMSNGVSYFKIKNTFDDSLNISYYDWQKMTIVPAKLYGFDTSKNIQYLIEDYASGELYGFDEAISYMPSIMQHNISELNTSLTDQSKSYWGWNDGARCFSIVHYDFTKNIGISRIEVSYECETGKIIEKISLIGSEIDGSISGIVW